MGLLYGVRSPRRLVRLSLFAAAGFVVAAPNGRAVLPNPRARAQFLRRPARQRQGRRAHSGQRRDPSRRAVSGARQGARGHDLLRPRFRRGPGHRRAARKARGGSAPSAWEPARWPPMPAPETISASTKSTPPLSSWRAPNSASSRTAPARSKWCLGDGRLSLERETGAPFDNTLNE